MGLRIPQVGSLKKINSLLAGFLIVLLVSGTACKREDPEDPTDQGRNGTISKGRVSVDNCLVGEEIINETPIEGYSSKNSYKPGEYLIIHAHSLSDFQVEISRVGNQVDLLHTSGTIPAQRQNFSCYSYSHGCNWEPNYVFQIPSNWKTGMYTAKLKSQTGEEDHIAFVLNKASSEPPARIAVLANTNTWAAYNNWGADLFTNTRSTTTYPIPVIFLFCALIPTTTRTNNMVT
ncbi:hypothetical protein KFE98_10745 [bacterium SCSIO 12741]|nr:hypothetical protein KFE98_10745 [bacterium SCSIO 12741]